MISLIIAAQLVTQPADIPADYLEKSRAIAEDSVVSGFCYSIGWQPDPAANTALEAEVDRIAGEHGVAGGLARETLMRQALNYSQTLRARLVTTPGDAAERRRQFDDLATWSREHCAAVAGRRAWLFTGDVGVNQARVDRNFEIMRAQIAPR